MLIGQSGARELLPRNHLEMTRTVFRKRYFLRRTSHDFENNRKILLMEVNRPLLSWKVTHYVHKKAAPLLFSTLTACLAGITRAAKGTTHCGSKFEDILTLMKEATVLICGSTSRSENLGQIPLIARMAKLHSAAPRAISLPFSLELMKFIPNFTPAHAIT